MSVNCGNEREEIAIRGEFSNKTHIVVFPYSLHISDDSRML